MSARPALLQDVADAAGVSLATASRALAGQGIVRPGTRARVEAAARQLGYQRLAAAAIMSSRVHRSVSERNRIPVAWLHAPLVGPDVVPHDHIGQEAAQERLAELGYSCEIHPIPRKGSLAPLSRMLYHRGVSGLIIGAMHVPLMQRGFDWTKIPAVACESFGEPWSGHSVHSWHTRMSENLIRRCLEKGFRRIAFCVGVHNPLRHDDLALAGGAIAAARMLHPELDLQIFPGTIGQWPEKCAFVKKVKPDAVIGFSRHDHDVFLKAGLRFPFAALRLDPPCVEEGHITGYAEPHRELALQAVEILDQQIRFRRPALSDHPVRQLIEPVFVEGRTL